MVRRSVPCRRGEGKRSGGNEVVFWLALIFTFSPRGEGTAAGLADRFSKTQRLPIRRRAPGRPGMTRPPCARSRQTRANRRRALRLSPPAVFGPHPFVFQRLQRRSGLWHSFRVFERTTSLMAAGVDMGVIDTAYRSCNCVAG
jgi:hypothetical protein